MKNVPFASCAVVALAGAASAQYSYPAVPGPLVVDDANSANLGAAPAGTWSSATVTAVFQDLDPGTRQTEAFVGFGSSANGFEYTAGHGFIATDAEPVLTTETLTWDILFDPATPYVGGSDLFLSAFTEFAAFEYQLSDINVTLGTEMYDGTPRPISAGVASPDAPSAIDLGVIGDAGTGVNLDTFGSELDTDIGIYAQSGELLAENDDARGLASQIILESASEAAPASYPDPAPTAGVGAGTYYIAIGGFNTFFEDGFDVDGGVSSGPYTGQINGLTFDGHIGIDEVHWYSVTVVPAPPGAVALGLFGLLGMRRRRS